MGAILFLTLTYYRDIKENFQKLRKDKASEIEPKRPKWAQIEAGLCVSDLVDKIGDFPKNPIQMAASLA